MVVLPPAVPSLPSLPPAAAPVPLVPAMPTEPETLAVTKGRKMCRYSPAPPPPPPPPCEFAVLLAPPPPAPPPPPACISIASSALVHPDGNNQVNAPVATNSWTSVILACFGKFDVNPIRSPVAPRQN